jgi:MOSC domain-containing protein YiiM
MTVAFVASLAVSGGGVPKLAITEADVTRLGLVGDFQRLTKMHGGPDRALCLYSAERIAALVAEGHPIVAGATGENLTTLGLDWDAIVPGVRLAIGADVVVEITSYTEPCNQIAAAFARREFRRMDQDRHPGWARVYARVLAVGHVRVGDPIARR